MCVHAGGGPKPAPIIIETPAPVVEGKENKKKPRQRTNPQQVMIRLPMQSQKILMIFL